VSKSYIELREETRSRDRSLRDKVMSLKEAADLVKDGDHVAIGGCTLSRTPMAMVWALIRAGRENLTVSRSITSTEGDLFYGSGVSRHIVTSWFSQGIVWGVSKVMRHFTETGQADFEEWSHMAMGLRYRAGAMGIPFMPTRTMMASDVGGRIDQTKEMSCPFTGEPLLLLPALNPDVALIHVQRCDQFGNAQMDGLPFMDADIAMAANRVVLTTERVVTNDQIRRAPDHTKIPFVTVDAVVEVPYGCAPHECYGVYEPFLPNLDAYAEMTRQDPVAGVQEFIDRYVKAPANWNEFLNLLGMENVIDAGIRGRSVYND